MAEIEGLKRKLTSKLGATVPASSCARLAGIIFYCILCLSIGLEKMLETDMAMGNIRILTESEWVQK